METVSAAAVDEFQPTPILSDAIGVRQRESSGAIMALDILRLGSFPFGQGKRPNVVSVPDPMKKGARLRGRARRGSQEPRFAEGVVAPTSRVTFGASENHVIEHRDLNRPCSRGKLPGNLKIRGGRGRITGRVVVQTNDGVRPAKHGSTENFARMNRA